MANIKSQKKRILTNAKAAERNKAVRSELKSRVKKAVTNIGDENQDETLLIAIRNIDVAAQKGVIHKNAAARKKSRLMKKVHAGA